MDVQIDILKEVRFNTQVFSVGTDEAQSSGCRFLHDIAQLSGQSHSFLTPHCRCLDKEQIASDWCPGKPYGNAGLGDTRVNIRHDTYRTLSLIHISEPTRLGMISYA